MLIHVLGWLTFACTIGLTGVAGVWLMHVGREQRTWLTPVPIPKPIEATLALSSGADFVGFV